MRDHEPVAGLSGFIALATLVLAVAVLYVAKSVMVPIALAILLAFLLSPVAGRLRRWGLGRRISVAVAATVAFAVIGLVGWLMAEQTVNLIQELPKFEHNIDAKLARLKVRNPPHALSGAIEMAARLQKELAAAAPTPASVEGVTGREPVAVEMAPLRRTPLEVARNVAAMVVGPLSLTGIVVVFVIAILLQGEDLRHRFVAAFGGGTPAVFSRVIDDAAERVSRYLAMQFVVNAAYGVVIGIGLAVIGIPHAPLWGLLATFLRFIPYLGPWIAAALPIVLGVAIDPGWLKVIATLALYGAAELITANIVEVLVYGATTGVSGLALMFAAVFWTWLWGLPGLFLSTPLTVCLLVLAESLPGFKFLSVLLGNSPLAARASAAGAPSAHPAPAAAVGGVAASVPPPAPKAAMGAPSSGPGAATNPARP
jgi:predicted PurR-regulated permease PerM